MTHGDINSILGEAKVLGNKIYNILPKFKIYEDKFEKDGATVNRDEIKAFGDKKMLEAYDEVMLLKQSKDVVCIIMSTLQTYYFDRYDITNGECLGDNCFKIVDRMTGDTHYLSADQMNTWIRYDEETTVLDYDRKTGEISDIKINEGKVRQSTFYQT